MANGEKKAKRVDKRVKKRVSKALKKQQKQSDKAVSKFKAGKISQEKAKNKITKAGPKMTNKKGVTKKKYTLSTGRK